MSAASDAEDRYVSIGGSKIRVRQVGEGPPLLLIMGIGGSLEMWEPLHHHLSQRRLIMFDFPGTGGSSAPRRPPTMHHNALLVRVLLQRLGFERVDVLGYSWGGLLAQQLAAQHPRCVRRLILACTAVGLGSVPASPRVAWRLLTPRRYYSPQYMAKIAPTTFGGRFRFDADLLEAEVARRAASSPSAVGYAMQLAATAHSTLPWLSLIRSESLVLAGTDDPIIPTPNQWILHALLKHSQVHLVQGAGHLLLLERPSEVGRTIEAFLSAGE